MNSREWQTSEFDRQQQAVSETLGSRSLRILDAIARYAVPLIAIIGLGALNLWYPIVGDQALFLMGAKAMDQGAVLYVDFWDFKQPGIFFFYWLAGRLFGFSAFGIHLFEIIWMCGLTVALIGLLKDYFHARWAASLVPVATIGVYYLGALEWHLTQVEILVALPIVLCIWLGTTQFKTSRSETAGFFLLGLLAACVAAFKLLLVLLPGAVVAVAMGYGLFRDKRPVTEIICRQGLPATFGLTAGLFLVAAWLWSQGALEIFIWTTFIAPFEAMSQLPPKSFRHLVGSTSMFSYLYFPWFLFVALAVYDFAKSRRDLLTAQVLVWLLLGWPLIIVQTVSWWHYHYLLLFVPAGILAVRGVDLVFARLSAQAVGVARISFVTWLVLIFPAFSTSMTMGFDKLAAAATTSMENNGNWLEEFQCELSETYRTSIEETRHLFENTALPGPIYVIGDPVYYLLAEREQAVALNAWSYETWSKPLWDALPVELSKARPAYLFVKSTYEKRVREQSPATFELIGRSYEVVRESPVGTWYRLAQDVT